LRRFGGRIHRRPAIFCRRRWLLGLWLVKEGRLAGPAFIGESGELLDLELSSNVLLLLFDGWGMFAYISEPLMPLCYSRMKLSATLSCSRTCGDQKSGETNRIARDRASPSTCITLTGNLHLAEMNIGVRLQHSPPTIGIWVVSILPESISGEIHA
jgi:hypothetical protein